MNDVKDDKSPQNSDIDKESGEIYSQRQKSIYEQATSPPTDDSSLIRQGEPLPPEEEISPPQGEFQQSPEGGGDDSDGPPPFAQEDSKKKLLVFAGLGVVLLAVLGFAVSFILSRKSADNSQGEQQEVSLVYWGLWEDESIMEQIIEEYGSSHPEIKIEYLKQDHKQYRERLQAAISRGEGPDIFRFHNTWVPMMKNELSTAPEEVLSVDEFKAIFYPVAAKDLIFEDRIYGIPLEIDGLVLLYNEDILRSANVPVPETWIDVQNAIPELTVKEGLRIVTSAIALGTVENIAHFSDILALMMLQNGVKLSDSLFSCLDAAKSTCAVEVLDYYRRFAEIPSNTWDETQENSVSAFAKGKAAMVFVPTWQIFAVKAANPELNFKVAPVPQLPCDRTPCPSVGWATYWVEGVSSKSPSQLQAWEFIKYLSSKEVMEKMYNLQKQQRQLFGEPYSRVDLAEKLGQNDYLNPLIIQAPNMQSFYLASDTHDGESGINTILINYLKRAVDSLSQGVSSESALKTADQGFAQVLTRFDLKQPSE